MDLTDWLDAFLHDEEIVEAGDSDEEEDDADDGQMMAVAGEHEDDEDEDEEEDDDEDNSIFVQATNTVAECEDPRVLQQAIKAVAELPVPKAKKKAAKAAASKRKRAGAGGRSQSQRPAAAAEDSSDDDEAYEMLHRGIAFLFGVWTVHNNSEFSNDIGRVIHTKCQELLAEGVKEHLPRKTLWVTWLLAGGTVAALPHLDIIEFGMTISKMLDSDDPREIESALWGYNSNAMEKLPLLAPLLAPLVKQRAVDLFCDETQPISVHFACCRSLNVTFEDDPLPEEAILPMLEFCVKLCSDTPETLALADLPNPLSNRAATIDNAFDGDRLTRSKDIFFAALNLLSQAMEVEDANIQALAKLVETFCTYIDENTEVLEHNQELVWDAMQRIMTCMCKVPLPSEDEWEDIHPDKDTVSSDIMGKLIGTLDNMCRLINADTLDKFSSKIKNDIEQDINWRMQHAAVLSAASLSTSPLANTLGVCQEVCMTLLLPLLTAQQKPARLRHAAAEGIGQLMDDIDEPLITACGLEPMVEGCIKAATTDESNRVIAHACNCLTNVIEANGDLYGDVIDKIITNITNVLANAQETYIQESAVTTLASALTASKEHAEKYFDSVTNQLLQVISVKDPAYTNLRLRAWEAFSMACRSEAISRPKAGAQAKRGLDALMKEQEMQALLEPAHVEEVVENHSYFVGAWFRLAVCLQDEVDGVWSQLVEHCAALFQKTSGFQIETGQQACKYAAKEGWTLYPTEGVLIALHTALDSIKELIIDYFASVEHTPCIDRALVDNIEPLMHFLCETGWTSKKTTVPLVMQLLVQAAINVDANDAVHVANFIAIFRLNVEMDVLEVEDVEFWEQAASLMSLAFHLLKTYDQVRAYAEANLPEYAMDLVRWFVSCFRFAAHRILAVTAQYNMLVDIYRADSGDAADDEDKEATEDFADAGDFGRKGFEPDEDDGLGPTVLQSANNMGMLFPDMQTAFKEVDGTSDWLYAIVNTLPAVLELDMDNAKVVQACLVELAPVSRHVRPLQLHIINAACDVFELEDASIDPALPPLLAPLVRLMIQPDAPTLHQHNAGYMTGVLAAKHNQAGKNMCTAVFPDLIQLIRYARSVLQQPESNDAIEKIGGMHDNVLAAVLKVGAAYDLDWSEFMDVCIEGLPLQHDLQEVPACMQALAILLQRGQKAAVKHQLVDTLLLKAAEFADIDPDMAAATTGADISTDMQDARAALLGCVRDQGYLQLTNNEELKERVTNAITLATGAQ